MAKLEVKIDVKLKRTYWYYVLIAFAYLGANIPKYLNEKVFMKAYYNGKEWFSYKVGDYLNTPDTDVAG